MTMEKTTMNEDGSPIEKVVLCVFFSDFPRLAMLVFKGGYRSTKSVVDI